jgi:hypothetical protein
MLQGNVDRHHDRTSPQEQSPLDSVSLVVSAVQTSRNGIKKIRPSDPKEDFSLPIIITDQIIH